MLVPVLVLELRGLRRPQRRVGALTSLLLLLQRVGVVVLLREWLVVQERVQGRQQGMEAVVVVGGARPRLM